MNEKPRITFVTVNYRMTGLIRQLLRGFEDAKLPFAFEYIMVDNSAGDGMAPMVRERYPWVRLIDAGGNIGFGAGNNIAFREAQGDYIMLINPDLTVFPGEFEKLLAFADAHPEIGMIGPRLLNPDGSLQRSFYRFPTIWEKFLAFFQSHLRGHFGKRAVDHYLMRDADPMQIQDVDGLFGAAILMRREVLQDIGFFDERFFMYFEDVDLCRRAWEKGWRVCYAPVAEFVHYHQRESRVKHFWQLWTNPVTRFHIKSAIAYFRKYWGKPHPRTK